MKICVYGASKKERPYFEEARARWGLQLELHEEKPCLESAHLARGCTCVSILSIPAPAPLLDAWHALGVRFLSTRTVGMDHIDLAHAKAIGMRVDNITYAPQTVADYTIMLILMSLRRVKRIEQKFARRDFSFDGVYGRNLEGRTVGVIGCGAIGTMLIRHLSGFGCRFLMYSRHEKEELRPYGRFVDLDTLLAQSDVVTLHLTLNAQTRHIIAAPQLARMKPDAVLVNTARGALIDTEALIAALREKRIGAAALDVLEQETGLYYYDCSKGPFSFPYLEELERFDNVILTPHLAWLSEEATAEMVFRSMESCRRFMNGGN